MGSTNCSRRWVAAAIIVAAMAACHAPWVSVDVTHGVASGEVTDSSATVWARCARESGLHVVLHGADGREFTAGTAVHATDDFTGKLRFDALAADTQYAYRAWCGQDARTVASGVLRTAPDSHSAEAVRFAWGGDLSGQNVCRDVRYGYSIFGAIQERGIDFFVALGDLIYADDPCSRRSRFGNEQVVGPTEPASDLPGFWAYWKYNRDDDVFRRFLATTPYYAVWDDHEVFDDFGPHRDVGPTPRYPAGRHLLPLGLKAFVDYNPFVMRADAPTRLYRSVRWGHHLELFLLDTRQYRDANSQADDPLHPKTMLGAEQRTWLQESLRRSDATWKVVVSSVPMSVPTGSPERGRDGWANFDGNTGFENELVSILRFLQAQGIRNQVWITTDAHFGAVFRYTPFSDDPSFHLHEVITGPLNAGVFTKHVFDTTLGAERLFLFGPDNPDTVPSFEEERKWFNFGVLAVDADGNVTIEIVDVTGAVVYRLTLPSSA